MTDRCFRPRFRGEDITVPEREQLAHRRWAANDRQEEETLHSASNFLEVLYAAWYESVGELGRQPEDDAVALGPVQPASA